MNGRIHPRSLGFNHTFMIANLHALAQGGPLYVRTSHFGNRPPGTKPEKPCLHCKRPHRTGKPFCSADCCREHKAAKQ